MANLDRIVKRHVRWLTNLPRVKPFYAVKCNNTPAVLKMLSALDTGFDCASKVLMKYFKDFFHNLCYRKKLSPSHFLSQFAYFKPVLV